MNPPNSKLEREQFSKFIPTLQTKFYLVKTQAKLGRLEVEEPTKLSSYLIQEFISASEKKTD